MEETQAGIFRDVQTIERSGLRVKAVTFKTNLGIYRGIGTRVKVRKGLLRRRNAERITICNYYFLDVSNSPSLPYCKTCTNCHSLDVKHFSVGVSISFPSLRPGLGAPELPIIGVVGCVKVLARETNFDFRPLQKGRVPEGHGITC